MKDADCPTRRLAVGGATETEMAGAGAIVIRLLDDFVESEFDVARRVTVAGLGTVVGATKVAEVALTFESVPHEAPEQPVPDRAQDTP